MLLKKHLEKSGFRLPANMRKQSITYQINIPVVSGAAVVMLNDEAHHIYAEDTLAVSMTFTVNTRWPWVVKKIDVQTSSPHVDRI